MAAAPYDWRPGPVFDLAFELAAAARRPLLCYVGTATGDDPARLGGVYAAFAGSSVQVSHYQVERAPDGSAVGTRIEPRRPA